MSISSSSSTSSSTSSNTCASSSTTTMDQAPLTSSSPAVKSNSSALTTKAWALGFVVMAATGVAFGFAMQKAWVFDPFIVRRQFAFSNFIMLKMFAAAGATSAFVLAALSLVAPQAFAATMKGAYTNDRGVVSAFIGGALIGMGGFVVAGSCPGTVFSQLGAGVTTSPLTFAGGLFGALIYGLVHPYLSGASRKPAAIQDSETAHLSESEGKAAFNFLTFGQPATPTLDKQFNVPYAAIAIPLGLVFAGMVIALEIVVPANDDLPAGTTIESDWVLAKRAWPPWASGLVLGSMQLPLALILNRTLGASTSFVSLLSSLMTLLLPNRAMSSSSMSYFKGKHIWSKSGFQLIFVIAAILGSFSSASLGDSFDELHGVHPAAAFFGGAIMLFGARLGGGCTSGHGLSGTAKLQWASFASFIGMFGFAVPLGLLWEYA
ncbi:YeeE/YedE family protein [Thecamonas trahens ATCC 50062]|uniref:YeeE/YedE family protein n=1 Tax=Thecamonas trahens ATCC 50062 TaxID=461836 RepID=A0A0L0DJM6_THETB|nr:YeeE/YedE family protein [Thecamonas trahens ATCC 50062]KNC52311.1 YeeE/YedE family protein [Thecamonas trahens ATCC 50062]|eukprot:XP_013762308.1 YeeE/YedE family protein [Thecamonas trahens ATCC 50062]